jgi:hypothetical protein
MNLILAVIVESAQDAKKSGDHELALLKEREQAAAADKFMKFCAAMDKDGTGTLTLKELQQGAKTIEDFGDVLKAMGVSDQDLETVFHILDDDRSGEIDFKELASELHTMKTDKHHWLLIFVKEYTKAMEEKLSADVKRYLGAMHQAIHAEIRELSGHALHHKLDHGGVEWHDNEAPTGLSSNDRGAADALLMPGQPSLFTVGPPLSLAQELAKTKSSALPERHWFDHHQASHANISPKSCQDKEQVGRAHGGSSGIPSQSGTAARSFSVMREDLHQLQTRIEDLLLTASADAVRLIDNKFEAISSEARLALTMQETERNRSWHSGPSSSCSPKGGGPSKGPSSGEDRSFFITL